MAAIHTVSIIAAAAVLAAVLLVSCQQGNRAVGETGPASSLAVPQYRDDFNQLWFDGQAEMAGYELTYPRYGEKRKGVAVTIFVTETFSNRLRVKADPGNHPRSDEFPVMKLNLIEDFQTGIYDYNMMTSTFLALQPVNGRPAGLPTKISFSSQEWCGHVYQQLLFDEKQIRNTSHSYFDGEADEQTTLNYPADGMTEDALFFWARGMAAPALEPGETVTVKLLPALANARLQHRELQWLTARLSRSAESKQVSVPAGRFEVATWTASIDDGGKTRTWAFDVEESFPHRIIAWRASDGRAAQLLGVDRMKYWELNGEGGEKALSRFGLKPRTHPAP